MGRWNDWQDHRSRSPGGGHSETISRALAQFARYPERRPKGLRVEADGSIKIPDLMYYWGTHQGYTEQQVLDAVRKHMFYDRVGPNGSQPMRYAIDSDASGVITIRVNLKRGGPPLAASTASPTPTPARSSVFSLWPGDGDGSKDRGGAPTPSSRCTDDGSNKWSSSSWSGQSWSGSSWSGHSWSDDLNSSPWRQNQPSQAPSSARGAWSTSKGGDYQRDVAEKVQRWLAYALRRGYEELRLEMKDGEWARLDDIAEAMATRKPEFGIKEAHDLRKLLEQEDEAGRFEIARGWVRKVPHDMRKPHGARKSEAAAAPSYVVKKEEMASDDEQAGGNGPNGAAKRADGRNEGPPPPPGDSPDPKVWTTYKDKEQYWYYYDGPLGKWWCADKFETPEPFLDDEEDEEADATRA